MRLTESIPWIPPIRFGKWPGPNPVTARAWYSPVAPASIHPPIDRRRIGLHLQRDRADLIGTEIAAFGHQRGQHPWLQRLLQHQPDTRATRLETPLALAIVGLRRISAVRESRNTCRGRGSPLDPRQQRQR